MGIKMLRLPGPGKNLCKVNNNTSGGTFTVKTEGQTLRITGTGASQWLIPSITHDAVATSLSSAKTSASGVKKFDAGQTYTVQIFGAVATITDLQMVSVDKANNASISLTNGKATFTPSWDVCDIYIRYNDATITTFNESITVQVEKGSTATAYESYQDYIYYPGVTNENDGKRGKLSLENQTWSRNSFGSTYVFTVPASVLSDVKMVTGVDQISNGLLSGYTFVSYNQLQSVDRSISLLEWQGTKNLRIRDDSYTNAADFKAAMSGKYLYYQRSTDQSWTPPFFSFLNATGGNS